MLHAVVRSPLLCDKYAKEDRKLMCERQASKAKREAVRVLSQYKFDEKNADILIKDLSESIN